MTNQPSDRLTIRQTISTTVGRTVKAKDLQTFLSMAPAEAEVRFMINQGDARDPREAGMYSITISATWNGDAK